MATPLPSARDLAKRLLAMEASDISDSGDGAAHEADRVISKLRAALTRFAGPDGFATLLRRALRLARVDVPALNGVTVKPDGSLEGLETLPAGGHNGAAEAITAHLLNLLIAFIGDSLTLQLVRDAWPQITETSLDENQPLDTEAS